MSTDLVFNALNNENNDYIIKYTSECIANQKDNVLREIVPRGSLGEFKRKLKLYRYCSDMDDVCFGRYIRWIPIKCLPQANLTNGGIICDLKTVDNSLHIVCKNNMNRLFQLNFDDNLVFSKLTSQELVILKILDYIGD